MQARNLLFFEGDLDDQLRDRQQKASEIVDGVPKDQFLISSNQELIEYVVSRLAVEPIVLDEERKTLNQQEARVEVPYDVFARACFSDNESRSHYTNGTRIDIDIPFTGSEWIFQYRTNSWFDTFPHANVRSSSLRITVALPCHAEPTSFKSNYEKEVNLIRQYIGKRWKTSNWVHIGF